jgi:hypothetical protein
MGCLGLADTRHAVSCKALAKVVRPASPEDISADMGEVLVKGDPFPYPLAKLQSCPASMVQNGSCKDIGEVFDANPCSAFSQGRWWINWTGNRSGVGQLVIIARPGLVRYPVHN